MAKQRRNHIVQVVKDNYEETMTLRERMDNDYNRWNLTPFTHPDLIGFKKVTSNEPRTQFNKVLSLLTTAKVLFQINQARRSREDRDIRNQAERFYIGAFKSNDERLERAPMGGKLQSLLAHSICLRGFFMGRALLVKGEGRRSPPFVDITPFDPRHTYWVMGPNGPSLVIHKTWKSPSMIKQQFKKNVPGRANEMIECYDWYDEEHNGLMTADQILKPATPHGSPCLPIFFGAAGPAPLMVAEGGVVSDTIKDWGESVFQANRANFDDRNFQMSIMSEFAARSVNRSYIVKSIDGTWTLDVNPWLSGTEINAKEGDEIAPLDAETIAPELVQWHAITSGEGQRGGIPWSSFGELGPGQNISGFAIGQLRQGQSTPLEPPLEALTSAYKQIARLLKEQYATGNFADITVEGRDNTRDYFSEEIPPEVVAEGGDPEISIVPELPQDDIQNAAMAIQLRTPDAAGNPLFSDRWIRENTMKVQDADSVGDELLEQQAIRGSKLASIRKMMMAALELGDVETAKIWFGEAQQEMLKEFLELQQLKAVAQQASQPQTNGSAPQNGSQGPPRQDPRVAPNAALGVQPPQPQPPQPVPPGQVRPGANNDVLTLASLGLFGPGG
jgi:hypothetical protein